jgi:hypothetical protein
MLEFEIERLAEMVDSRFFGKYRGIVSDNQDTESRGRLQVKVPTVLGDQTVWALPCVPVANTDGSGFFAMPDVDACVWVEFEAGNLNYPIWTGCFWPADAISSQDAAPMVKFWKTKNFTIRIDDDGGELTIEKADGGKLTISATEFSAEANSVKQTAGGQATTLSQSSFDVNNGAFTVM